MRKKVSIILVSMMMAICMAACGSSDDSSASKDLMNMETVNAAPAGPGAGGPQGMESYTGEVVIEESMDEEETYTERDLEQEADLSDSESFTLSDGEDITITAEGVYVISGSAKNVTIYVEAGDEDKVQIVLDGATIINESMPCIYVKSADKVFVTTTDSENDLEVTGTFTEDGDTKLDAVIFSKDDLVLNGEGTLDIVSTDNGVACKDTLKITGGTVNVSCTDAAFEANDAIEIADGVITVTACNDGLHAENDEDDSVGYIFISGGKIDIIAADDAIHATTMVQIDDGEITLTGAECIEGTYIQVNGGNIVIEASDDGINASQKSSAYTPTFEMNGGTVKITMGAGDTDGVDSNGHIIINDGTIDISGQSTFDYDGTAEYNGGTIIENGEETNTITNQFAGGMGGGNFGGGNFNGGFGGDGPH